MANTHMSLIKHMDGRLTFVSAGDEGEVRSRLDQWLRTHQSGFYETPMVLEVIDPVTA